MFQGKSRPLYIEMCDAFNVFATFTVLWEKSRLLEEIKIIGQGDMYFRDCLGTRDKVLHLVVYFNNRTSTYARV